MDIKVHSCLILHAVNKICGMAFGGKGFRTNYQAVRHTTFINVCFHDPFYAPFTTCGYGGIMTSDIICLENEKLNIISSQWYKYLVISNLNVVKRALYMRHCVLLFPDSVLRFRN